MLSFKESLEKGYLKDEFGYYFKFGNSYEIRFEPLIFDAQFYVAVYENGILLTDKIVIKPGK